MVPALLGLIISEQSTHNKICPKKRHADPWEDFLGGKRQLGWALKDDNRWYPPHLTSNLLSAIHQLCDPSKLLNFSVPPFPHLESEPKYSTNATGFCDESLS